MRIVRVIQLLVTLALIGYLFVLHSVNPQTIILPFLISLPTSWVLTAALVLGFAVGWLSLSGRVWRLSRENRSLRQRLIKAGGALEIETPDARAQASSRGAPGNVATFKVDADRASSGTSQRRSERSGYRDDERR